MTVSIIIPTIGRQDELYRLLDSFAIQSKMPDQIIIIDQNKENNNESLRKYIDQLPIVYVHADFQSLTKARNLGVTYATSDIIGFLDDDIILEQDYIAAVLSFFHKNRTALGVQGLITNFDEGHVKKIGNMFLYTCYRYMALLFFLNRSGKRNKLLLSARNVYASNIARVQTCEWMSGIGNYKRQVFTTYAFDESLGGYALGEDKLFSYPIHQQHPGTLYISPAIRCEHHHAETGRPTDERWVQMRVDNTYYIWKTLCAHKGILAWLAFWWANLGDVLVSFFGAITGKQPFGMVYWHARAYIRLLWKK